MKTKLNLSFFARLLFGAFCVVVISSCSMKSNIRKLGNVIDFAATEIIAETSAIADGVDQLVVVVHLKNSDGSVVPNYRPEYSIVTGSTGVMASSCTISSNEGASICILKSSAPGVKKLRLTNAKLGLEKEVTFVPKPSGPALGLISAADNKGTTVDAGNNPSGYKMKVSLGAWASSPQSVSSGPNPGYTSTAGGYKAFISIERALDSRN